MFDDFISLTMLIPYELDYQKVIEMFNSNGVMTDDCCSAYGDGHLLRIIVPKTKYIQDTINNIDFYKNRIKEFSTIKNGEVMNWKEEKLKAGETIISKEPGNSMAPRLKSRQPVKLAPVKLEELKIGDIVYCKVRGNYYTHLVKGIDKTRGALIGNNHGRINGWTKNVFGKVIEILQM